MPTRETWWQALQQRMICRITRWHYRRAVSSNELRAAVVVVGLVEHLEMSIYRGCYFWETFFWLRLLENIEAETVNNFLVSGKQCSWVKVMIQILVQYLLYVMSHLNSKNLCEFNSGHPRTAMKIPEWDTRINSISAGLWGPWGKL